MRVAITGATGMVGTALGHALRARGEAVVPVSRRPLPDGARWDPERHEIDLERLRGIDAVVHLAGENLGSGRWTAPRKQLLRASRGEATRWLAETLATLDPRPGVLISASAVGIYGNRDDEVLTEDSRPGEDFLARLALEWEAGADPARQAGIRVVHPRFGLILSPTGGALARMLLPFRLGVGGRFGTGRQWMSWITIDDVVAAVLHALNTPLLEGPVNFTTPHPVRNADFAHALGRVLHRPAMLPVPALALRLLFGEMADATVLASQRALPVRLEASGYRLQHQEVVAALRHVLTEGH